MRCISLLCLLQLSDSYFRQYILSFLGFNSSYSFLLRTIRVVFRPFLIHFILQLKVFSELLMLVEFFFEPSNSLLYSINLFSLKFLEIYFFFKFVFILFFLIFLLFCFLLNCPVRSLTLPFSLRDFKKIPLLHFLQKRILPKEQTVMENT